MTLLEFAGRLLKGSGLPQQPPGDHSSTKPTILVAKVNDPSFIASPGPYTTQPPNPEVMVASDFREPRAQSAHVISSWAKIRPLSDIRELTEPSLADTIPRKLLSETNLRSLSRPDLSRKPSFVSHTRPSIDVRFTENREPEKRNSFESTGIQYARGRSSRSPSPKPADNQSITSIYSIPPGSVPPRSSSRTRNRSDSRSCPPGQRPSAQATQRIACKTSLSAMHMAEQLPPRGVGLTVPRRGHSQSPLREVAARLDPISHDIHRRIPSRTFIREPVSKDILEFPSHRHPRIDLGLDLSAGIFVGGGSIEGTAQIRVDNAERIRHRRTLDIARISIDLLSLEEMNGNRRCVFLNLANELIDEQNPPPTNMVDSQEPIGSEECFWHLMPSLTNLAFNLSLPLNVGPPPFHSKNARIRYVLCVSLLIRDQGKQYIVRTSEEVTVLSVYDPEKALMSLPSPLTACDEWIHPRDNTIEIVRVTAGLHRQVWVSGTSIYADVHIANNSRKTIKKIELQLERDILCYKHAAAWTMEKSAGQARIFDSNERAILSRTTVKQGTAGWHRVPAHQTHIRTCDLEVPRGHATVKCGKYFEVRYFLNVIVGSAHTLVTVQLPIVLIHMNSLDVVPNSVAQVAVAIEEKRLHHRSHSPHHRPSRHMSNSVQGRAFAAPRMQSLEQIRARTKDLQELGQVLDRSPRKYPTLHQHTPTNNFDYHTPPSNRKARIVDEDEAAALQIRLRRGRSNATISSHQNLNRDSSIRSKGGTNSALGFREAEVREDMELAGLDGVDDAPFKSRLERSRGRQYRFSKKKSGDRWRGVANVGVGWLKGRDTGDGKIGEAGREGWL